MILGINLTTAFLVFIAYLIVDALYAYYTLEVVKLQPYRAATIGAFMHFLLAFGVVNYVQDIRYLIPLAAGSWIGTFIAVAREKKLRASS